MPTSRTTTTLWSELFDCAKELRPGCTRKQGFLWLVVALLGLCTRADMAGVTSWIRAGFLSPHCYRRLLHMLHSTSIRLDRLTQQWVGIVLTRFRPLEVHGFRIAVADGLKIPKEGRRMPGVKSLHQESQNNSKAPYIMGHSFQVVGLLVEGNPGPVCVPLASRLHEGVKNGPGEKRTLLDKLVALFLPLAGLLQKPVILLADAYYASRKVVLPLLKEGHHLVTRVRSNCVAYRPAPTPKKRRRGRPRVYGEKVRLADLWGSKGFVTAPSPAYGEEGVTIRYLVQDLLWRPVGCLVRFVLVDHPSRGRLILMTTHTSLPGLEVIRLYAYRFKIEVSFKQAVHTLGTYAYHFWMKAMPRLRRGDGDQYLHRKPEEYRRQVRRKVAAYELHAQLGCIAQGLLQHLAVNFQGSVWGGFRGWMRTMHTEKTPSESVAAHALRSSLPEFLLGSAETGDVEKFLRQQVDWSRVPGIVMAT